MSSAIIISNSKKGINLKETERLQNSSDTKKCTGCPRILELKYFINKSTGKETKKCLSCRNSHNKSEKREGTNRKIMNDFYKQLKARSLCIFCGDNNPDHIEFDHIDPNTKICAVCDCKTVMAMYKEFRKCRALCKKCHLKVTQEQNAKLKKKENINREYINRIKIKIGKCQYEGCTDIFDKDNLSFYEFDHQNQDEKEYTISQMSGEYYSFKHIDKEIAKCRLLCSFCHYRFTRLQNKENYELFDVEDDLERKERHKDETALTVRILYMTGNFSQTNLSSIFGFARTYINRIINEKRKNELRLGKDTFKSEFIKYVSKVYLNNNTVTKYTGPTKQLTQEELLLIRIFYMTGNVDRKQLSDIFNNSTELISKYSNDKRKDFPKKSFDIKLDKFKITFLKYVRKIYL
jgi:hypothetical protein